MCGSERGASVSYPRGRAARARNNPNHPNNPQHACARQPTSLVSLQLAALTQLLRRQCNSPSLYCDPRTQCTRIRQTEAALELAALLPTDDNEINDRSNDSDAAGSPPAAAADNVDHPGVEQLVELPNPRVERPELHPTGWGAWLAWVGAELWCIVA